MISQIRENPEISVVAKRVKRSEGVFFKSLYEIHKLITYLFTGKKYILAIIAVLQKKMLALFIKSQAYGAVTLEP